MAQFAQKKDHTVSEPDNTLTLMHRALTAATGGAMLRDASGEVLHNSLRFEIRKIIDEFGDDLDGMEREMPGDKRIALRRQVFANGCSLIWCETVTELRRAEEELFRVYYTDELTGLDNWKGISRTGEGALGLYHRYKRPLSVLRIDITGPVNFEERDNRDQIIKHVGDVIDHALRLVDSTARLSTGRFVALMPETDLEGAEVAAQRLIERIARSKVQDMGVPIDVAIAVGIATPGETTETFEELVEEAARDMRRRQSGPELTLVSAPGP